VYLNNPDGLDMQRCRDLLRRCVAVEPLFEIKINKRVRHRQWCLYWCDGLVYLFVRDV